MLSAWYFAHYGCCVCVSIYATVILFSSIFVWAATFFPGLSSEKGPENNSSCCLDFFAFNIIICHKLAG